MYQKNRIMLKFLVIYVTFNYAACVILDLPIIDDHLTTLWNVKHSIEDKKYGECEVKTLLGTKYGVCLHVTHCLLTRGVPNGFCGFLSTCCTYERSCNARTKSKVSYFIGTGRDLDSFQCNYKIDMNNPNICQIRLDFDDFNLAPATLVGTQYVCQRDALLITPNNYAIPTLCGYNRGQHVYIHVNNTKTVSLKIISDTTNDLWVPYWNIRITQLECPLQGNNEAHRDFLQLAPLGSIQYFTNNEGIVRSFGFNSSSYTAGQYYSIAFKRYPRICGVSFTTDYFNLTKIMRAGADETCYDYLFVPGLTYVTANKPVIAKLCVNDYITFTSTPPGPLYVYFDSRKQNVADRNILYAFELMYRLTDC